MTINPNYTCKVFVAISPVPYKVDKLVLIGYEFSSVAFSLYDISVVRSGKASIVVLYRGTLYNEISIVDESKSEGIVIDALEVL